tara:strand:- start:1472 stop:1807 length:336 start_codon:yes stop_codon:yes gene_type:complete
MGKGDLGIEKYFSQLKVNDLPNGRKPKYKIGDLVKIRFNSDYCPTSSYVLKDGIGLIAEIIFYECRDYGVDDPMDRTPFYLIEYKLIPAKSSSEFRYVSEQYLYPLEEGND